MSSEKPTGYTLGRYAGLPTHLFARIVDDLLASIVVAMITIPGQFVVCTIRFNQLLGTEDTARFVMNVIAGLTALLIAVLYNIVFWTLAGQTPGKRMMGVRVVRTNGDLVNLRTAVKRQIGILVSGTQCLGHL